jgi:4-amino-4-deoxy-L-arabinose transferase-like glycosyltransferase
MPAFSFMKQSTPLLILVAVLLAGALLRLAGAVRAPLELIERDEFIPAAMTISWQHLPLRAAQHGAVPIYLIRTSGLLFGDSTLGLRLLSVIAGTATILLLYLIAKGWWGTVAGLVAAGLLAIERYHIAISGRAIDLPYDLFFVVLAMFSFSRFLQLLDQQAESSGRAGPWLYATSVACALGFLCKEFTAIMLPVLLLSFVFLRQTAWLGRRETWIAVGLFFLIILPDAYSSLTVTRAERLELLGRHREAALRRGVDLTGTIYVENGLFMSYGDQLSRFRSFGLNSTPFYFYFGDLLNRVGLPLVNGFREFPFMHSLLGIVLWIGVAVALASRRRDKLTVFALTMFFTAFLPFTLVQLGPPRTTLPSDPTALWYWVDRTMLPAMLLTGRMTGWVLKW